MFRKNNLAAKLLAAFLLVVFLPWSVVDDVQAEKQPSSLWIDYRDKLFGYGFVAPSQWILDPSGQGQQNTFVTNYDENFVRSLPKGDIWKEGAVKVSFVVFERIGSSLTLTEAIQKKLENDFSSIVSTESGMINTYPNIVVTSERKDTLERHTSLAFRLSSDKVLLMSVMPESGWGLAEVQAIQDSLVLSPQDAISIPTFTPAEPLIEQSFSIMGGLYEYEIHPCGYGDEVGDSPIELFLPFTENTT